jgi:hypothetical protein
VLSLSQYVFVASEGEVKDGAVSATYYGVYEASTSGAAFAPGTYTGSVAVYLDSALTEKAEGVSAKVEGKTFTLTGVNTKENTVYYLATEDGASATTIYVVNQEYDKDSATLTLADGKTVEVTTYAPNMANGDYTADAGKNSVDESGDTSVFIGGNRTVLSVDDFSDLANASDGDKALAAWWLTAGATNGGTTLTTFGDTMYGCEYVVALYRLFQVVNEQMPYVSGFDSTCMTYASGMGSNDQFSDAIEATLASGFWNGIVTQESKTLMPGSTEANPAYLLENMTGADGKVVTSNALYEQTTVEVAYVTLYNAFQSGWSTLSEEGKETAKALAAAATDDSNASKIAAVSKVLVGEANAPAASTKLSKLETINLLYKARNCFSSKQYSDESFAEATGTSYADMTQYFKDAGKTGLTSTSDEAALIMKSAEYLNQTIGTAAEGTAGSTAAALHDPSTSIDGMAAAMGGIQAEVPDAPENDGFIYNATFRNAYYREGIGAGITIVNEDTDVTMTSDNGTLVLSGSGGSMAGTAYVGFGASLLINNAVAYSSSQHLTNNLYNGTIHYLDSYAVGSGRVYSSDFWGGYQVFEDSIANGGNVTDEPTTLVVKNSVFGNSLGGNGYASQYFENSYLDVTSCTFQNTTSCITDVAALTLVNSVADFSNGTLVTVNKAENAVVTLADSDVTLAGNVLANLTDVRSEGGMSGIGINSTNIFDKTGETFGYSELALKLYGDNTIATSDGTLTVDVEKGNTLYIYGTIEGAELVNTGEGEVVVVSGDEYGTLTVAPVITSVTYGDKYVATTATEDDTINSPSASTNITSVTLSDGTVIKAEGNGVLTLVVNGEQYDILDYVENHTALKEGTYEFATTAATKTASGMGKFMNMGGQTAQYTFRAALTVTDGKIDASESIPALTASSTVTDTSLTGGSLVSNGAFFNGVIVNGASEYTIKDLTIKMSGDGADDFSGVSAGVLADGTSTVTLDGVVIDTNGVIRTATAVNNSAKLYIKNSAIFAQESQDTEDEYNALVVPMMKRTPFALGIEGVIRATNVLGGGQGIYSDSIVVSTGWGVLSTDSGQSGTHALDVTNVLAGIGDLEVAQNGKTYTATKEVNGVTYGYTMTGSGYVAYADSGVYDTFENVEFYSPDYIQIMASSTSSATYTNSVLNSDRIAVMTQQNAGGTITIKDSTVNVTDTLVQIKSGAANNGYTNVVLDNANVNITGSNPWSGALVELVESDDAGNPGVTTFTVEDTGESATLEAAQGIITASNATLKNGTYTGDIYNNIYNYYQELNVTLESANLIGTVSSAIGHHAYEDGTRIENGTVLTAATTGDYRTDPASGGYRYIGAQVNVASATVCNPVNLTIDANSSWTVEGTNYVNQLSVASESAIKGSGTINVSEYTVGGVAQADGTYTVGNVTINVQKSDNSDILDAMSDNGVLYSGQDYNGNAFTIKVVDQDGNNASRYLDAENAVQSFTSIGFNVVIKDEYKDTVTLADITYENGAVADAEPINGFAYGFTITADAAQAGGNGGNDAMPGGDMGGGDMPGGDMGGGDGMPDGGMGGGDMGGMGGSSSSTATVTIILNVSETSTTVSFPDVADSAWYAPFVQKVAAKGIVNGYEDGTFRPDNTLTRAEAAKMIALAAGLSVDESAITSFADANGDWYTPYIAAAAQAGIINGYPDGTFAPNGKVTRAELAKMIVAAKKLATDENATVKFTDGNGDWYTPYIAAAVDAGIVNGYEDNTVKPNNSVKRSEAAKMIATGFLG